MISRFGFASLAILAAFSTAAFADFQTVRDEGTFRSLVAGKELQRPMIRLVLTQEGRISGQGGFKPVSGAWRWQDGYFCRELVWGDRNLGHNCQEVGFGDGRLRFTADRGRGESADFRLTPQ